MGSTINPPTLLDLQAFWVAQHGTPLGIKGDAKHAHRGVSYHLGKGDLIEDAYSIQSKRDRAGLSRAASAIDLGALDGSFDNLRAFSRWLAARCMADGKVRKDIREIIYTADGKRVQRYSGIDNRIHVGPGNGDKSHLRHTHISYFRDSEFRDKIEVFRPFFRGTWDPAVAPELQQVDPSARKVILAIRRTGHDFGSLIGLDDLKAALEKIHHDFGFSVDPGDVTALVNA